jgi:hypothetical protein
MKHLDLTENRIADGAYYALRNLTACNYMVFSNCDAVNKLVKESWHSLVQHLCQASAAL